MSKEPCREAFEEHATQKRNAPLLKYSDGTYQDTFTAGMWDLWQAAWNARDTAMKEGVDTLSHVVRILCIGQRVSYGGVNGTITLAETEREKAQHQNAKCRCDWWFVKFDTPANQCLVAGWLPACNLNAPLSSKQKEG